MAKFNEKTVAEVEQLIRDDIEMSALHEVDTQPYKSAVAAVTDQVAAAVEEARKELERSSDAGTYALKEKIDNVFDQFLGDGLRDDIRQQCGFAEDDDDDGHMQIVERLWTEMKSVFLKRLAA